jgi:DegV family protein with EDD domain
MSIMDSVALITDSSACLSETHAPVRIVPVVIHLPDVDVHGDSSEAASRVYAALQRNEPVKSSAPSALEYLQAIEETDAEEVVVVTPAVEFTNMFHNASVAAELSERPVIVVDSRTAAAAHGLVVERAADAAGEGGSAADTVRAAEDAARRTELVATLDGLDYIRRSGRIPPAAVGLARHLGVRPVFRLHQGVVERLGVPRSLDSATDRVIREAQYRGIGEAARRLVFHAADPERASVLQRRLDIADATEFSPSMGIHTGPGVVGVAWLRPSLHGRSPS